MNGQLELNCRKSGLLLRFGLGLSSVWVRVKFGMILGQLSYCQRCGLEILLALGWGLTKVVKSVG
jgi:hypothetical protein